MTERLPTANQSPAELKRQLEFEREGRAFVVFRDGHGELVIVPLSHEREMTVGRSHAADISLPWDVEVSHLHAELRCVGEDWVLVDDGVSLNGTFINGERITGRRRLCDHDLMQCGRTLIVFRDPAGEARATALPPEDQPLHITETQRRVLIELCRTFSQGSTFGTPAPNRVIAAKLYLSVDAVKTHLHALFETFGVADLPQNRKRAALAERAVRTGAVTPRDLTSN